jgi:hypothetical protein
VLRRSGRRRMCINILLDGRRKPIKVGHANTVTGTLPE